VIKHADHKQIGIDRHYIQISVISNGVNTRYYANNRKQEYKQTFYWADKDNSLITQLEDFADCFLMQSLMRETPKTALSHRFAYG